MEQKFELFGCCMGNSTSIFNKAVIEYGEYKHIANISESGRIKWYVKNPARYVPEQDMKTIKSWSESARKKFMERWDALPDLKKYEIVLDEIPYTVLLSHPLAEDLKACTDLHEKVLMLEKIYFENYA